MDNLLLPSGDDSPRHLLELKGPLAGLNYNHLSISTTYGGPFIRPWISHLPSSLPLPFLLPPSHHDHHPSASGLNSPAASNQRVPHLDYLFKLPLKTKSFPSDQLPALDPERSPPLRRSLVPFQPSHCSSETVPFLPYSLQSRATQREGG